MLPMLLLMVSTAARPINPGSWVTSADYPAQALRDRSAGAVGFSVGVSADGTPTDCSITQTSGAAILDAATCALVKERARFTPAQDNNGRPIAARYDNTVRWVIPQQIPPVPQQRSWVTFDDYPPEALRRKWQGVTGFTVAINSDGTVVDCQVQQSSGHDVLDRATCAIISKRARFLPARQADGTPIPSTFSSTVRWVIP